MSQVYTRSGLQVYDAQAVDARCGLVYYIPGWNHMSNLTNIIAILDRHSDDIIDNALRSQYALEGHKWNKYGTEGMRKSFRDSRYNMAYLLAALRFGEPAILGDYLTWLNDLFNSLGFAAGTAVTTIKFLCSACTDVLDPGDGEALLAFVNSATVIAEQPVPETSSSMDDPRATRYLELILRERRQEAVAYIMSLHDAGTAIKDIYLSIFGPAQRELGRLWQLRKISVAQEHFGTAVTQLTMARLYPHMFSGERKSRRMAAAGVGGELHELGIRMVADFFEMDGWDSRYYGSNLPAEDLAKSLSADKPDLLCLSATMPWHVDAVRDSISAIRLKPQLSSLPILVGGRPFAVSTELWRTVGADGTALDAQGAIELANRMRTGAA
jgi:methanogenic corrinoid protein MtbC1